MKFQWKRPSTAPSFSKKIFYVKIEQNDAGDFSEISIIAMNQKHMQKYEKLHRFSSSAGDVALSPFS